MYVTTQIYEEAKHTELFDRYWRNVINPIEEANGWEKSSTLEERWFNDAYDELFERNERATSRLLGGRHAREPRTSIQPLPPHDRGRRRTDGILRHG
jgi:hypothetical protein